MFVKLSEELLCVWNLISDFSYDSHARVCDEIGFWYLIVMGKWYMIVAVGGQFVLLNFVLCLNIVTVFLHVVVLFY